MKEYTKHYYSENQRIASKVGSGYSNKDSIDRNDTKFHTMLAALQGVTIPAEDSLQVDFSGDKIDHLNGGGGREDLEYYYTCNHLSSTQLVTDGTGVAVQQVEYAPFGEVVNEYNIDWNSGQVPDFKFNGKELDEENGMYYFEARYQSPPVFISRDPLFEKYPMFSPYAYCYNNPLLFIDPTGMEGDVTDLVTADKKNNTSHTQELTKSLSKITGLNVGVEQRGEMSFLTYQKDDKGRAIIQRDENGDKMGSSIARRMLKKMIDNKNTLIIGISEGNNDSHGKGKILNLNFAQINSLKEGVRNGLNPETVGYGMIFLHELHHTDLGRYSSHDDMEMNYFGYIGWNIATMNKIRSQLGADYGQRTSYGSMPDIYDECHYLPFSQSARSIMNLSGSSVLDEFSRQLLGNSPGAFYIER